jgi:magnesium transporter
MTALPVATEDRKELNIEQVTWEGLTWVNIQEPTNREIEYLAQHYPFHPLDLDDCLSRVQRPKIDEYEQYFFVVLHFPVFNKQARVTTPSQVSLFVGDSYLISLHAGNLKPLVKLFRECQLSEEARRENMSKGSGYLLYRIVDRLVDYCFPILNKIIENIERVEDRIFEKTSMATTQELAILRRDLISYRRIIWPLRAVVGILERKASRFTSEDMEVYFGDVIDHTDKIWDALDEYKEVLESLSDTSNWLIANHTNEVMRILTIIATIMLPLAVVTGVYGMNVRLPGGIGSGNPYTLAAILVFMAVIAGGMLLWFRRRRWI